MSAYLEYLVMVHTPLLKFDRPLCFLHYLLYHIFKGVSRGFLKFFNFFCLVFRLHVVHLTVPTSHLPLTIIIIPLFTIFAIDKMHKDFRKILCNLTDQFHLTKILRCSIMEIRRSHGPQGPRSRRQIKKSLSALSSNHSRSNPCKD